MFRSEAELVCSAELRRYARGLEGISGMVRKTVDAPQTTQDRSAPTDQHEGNLRFKVIKITKLGIRHTRILELNVSAGLMRILQVNTATVESSDPATGRRGSSIGSRPSLVSEDVLSISQMSQIEKSNVDPLRTVIMFYGDMQPPLDLIFLDKSTRDVFCELLRELNSSVVFKVCCFSLEIMCVDVYVLVFSTSTYAKLDS
jgi:hypothetical protein